MHKNDNSIFHTLPVDIFRALFCPDHNSKIFETSTQDLIEVECNAKK